MSRATSASFLLIRVPEQVSGTRKNLSKSTRGMILQKGHELKKLTKGPDRAVNATETKVPAFRIMYIM